MAEDTSRKTQSSSQGDRGACPERSRLETEITNAEALASEHELQSKKMVRASVTLDIVTVFFSAASPALTTFVAYNQGNDYFKLAVILVVALAVSIPAIKRLLGIKKKAVHSSASAMDLHKAVSLAHDEMRRIGEDVVRDKQGKYYDKLTESLRARISEVKQRHNRLTFDIMEESHVIAEQEAKKAKKEENNRIESVEE